VFLGKHPRTKEGMVGKCLQFKNNISTLIGCDKFMETKSQLYAICNTLAIAIVKIKMMNVSAKGRTTSAVVDLKIKSL
jgi:hypothetical protein